MTALGNNVRAAMVRRKLETNAQLAKLTGIREGDLSRLLNRDDPNPGLKTLLRLAKALETSVEALIDGVDAEYTAKLRRDFSWTRLQAIVYQMNDDQRSALVTMLHVMLAAETVGPK